jgi:hypothetical protein
MPHGRERPLSADLPAQHVAEDEPETLLSEISAPNASEGASRCLWILLDPWRRRERRRSRDPNLRAILGLCG